MKKLILILLLFLSLVGQSQVNVRKEIIIPEIENYIALKGDFHVHTIFSDGTVWPTNRIEEAWREGLDVISITDHLEYQPHKAYVDTNTNNAFIIAKEYAQNIGIILIPGAEITRDMPPGHLNALFVTDTEPLKTKNALDAINAAYKQGAFIFWNHPAWKAQVPGTPYISDMMADLIKKGIVKGMEVVNEDEYSSYPHQWCIDKNITMMGNSDVHAPMNDFLQEFNIEHRPMTILFTRDSSIASIKEALISGRTIIWHRDNIIGKESLLKPLFENSIRVTRTGRYGKNYLWIEIENKSSFTFILQSDAIDTYNYYRCNVIYPLSRSRVLIKKDMIKGNKLDFEVSNMLVSPGKGLVSGITL